jgi:hypothetical protein
VFQNHDWLAVIDPVPREQRLAAFVELYKKFLVSCGASYVLPFPIFDASGQLKYHLVHASKARRGYEEMKDAISHAVNNGPLDDDVRDQIRAAMACDLEAVVQQMMTRFAGQRVRWTKDKENPSAPFLHAFVLQETAAMPWHCEEIKRRFASYKVKESRTLLYDIPAAT